MMPRKSQVSGELVSIPGVGKMVRVAREMAGGTQTVEYSWPRSWTRADTAGSSPRPTPATAERLAVK